MSYSVYQHWDPLKVCVVGRSYPPEFYCWIQIPHVRELFERIAIETEEDFQNIIKKLGSFGVKIMRPEIEITDHDTHSDRYEPPPMTPRDDMIMIGETFYGPDRVVQNRWATFYSAVKDPLWPSAETYEDFRAIAEPWQIEEVIEVHRWTPYERPRRYEKIIAHIADQGNAVMDNLGGIVNGAMVSRIGRDLYFSTPNYSADLDLLKRTVDQKFPSTRNHVINTGGHGDGTYCPVCPGLIISLRDVPTYADTFPGWEVVYLPGQSWEKVQPFLDLKKKNKGRWWIPGFEYDDSVVQVVETWLDQWVGYVEETVFDVNMLIIDPKNVMVFNENDQVFRALERYGITPHVVPFRHRYFWDGGIHCVTLDLHRDGVIQDFFPDRRR